MNHELIESLLSNSKTFISPSDIPDGIYNYPVHITNHSYKVSSVIFRHITFNREFLITNVNLMDGIQFQNCVFLKGIHLSNISFEGPQKDFNSNLLFYECEILEDFHFFNSNIEIPRSIELEKCKINSRVLFKEVRCQSIVFRETTFAENLQVELCHAKQNIHFTNCKFETHASIISCVSNDTMISNNIFDGPVSIKKCTVKSNIALSENTFLKYVSLDRTSGGVLNIIRSTFSDTVTVSNRGQNQDEFSPLKLTNVVDCDFIDSLKIEGGDITIGVIILSFSTRMKGSILISNTDAEQILLNGINTNAIVKLSNVSVRYISFKDFYNQSQLLFSYLRSSTTDSTKEGNPRKQSEFSVVNSDLGASQFISVDLQSFEKVHFAGSSLSQISISNITWFKFEQFNIIPNEKAYLKVAKSSGKVMDESKTLVIDYKVRQEAYRQLKLVCNKYEDKFQALEFRKYEMICYKNYLKLTKHKNWGDRFILWSSQTNDFGQNWIKPLWIGLLITFIIYIPFACLGSENLVPFKFANSLEDVKWTLQSIFCLDIRMYFQLINPTHSLEKIVLNVESKSGVLFFIDIILRITVTPAGAGILLVPQSIKRIFARGCPNITSN